MKTNETLKLLDDKDFLDKIYHFSYHRCNTSFEAEDLCSDIILAVISAIHKQERIENFYAFVWTIAHRVYADFYGCDGIDATSIGGYKSVFASNIYGKHIDKHFHCGHNLSHDPKLLMVLRAIGGIAIDDLSESEKEIAAKALDCGYLRKNGNIVEPKIIVIDRKNAMDFYNLSFDFSNDMGTVIEQIAAELSVFMKTHIPEHLMNEYPIYTGLIAGVRILAKAIEECINEGLLVEPENKVGAEGVLMIVEK